MPGNKDRREYTIQYLSSVVDEDIPALPKTWKEKIKKAIESKLRHEPEVFGKPLRKSLKGFRSLRVGITVLFIA